MEKISNIFKALSDPNRLKILKMLQVKTLCVCEITEMLQLAASTVSQHLSILKKEGFIVEEKAGKWVNYSLNPKPEDQRVATLISLLNFLVLESEFTPADKEIVCGIDRNVVCCK